MLWTVTSRERRASAEAAANLVLARRQVRLIRRMLTVWAEREVSTEHLPAAHAWLDQLDASLRQLHEVAGRIAGPGEPATAAVPRAIDEENLR